MIAWHIFVYFAIALLAGLGVGSGGLLIAYLTFTSELPHEKAVGVNLIFFVVALSVSVAVSIKNKKLSPGMLLLLLFSGGLGAASGSLLSVFVSHKLVRATFAIFMIVTGGVTTVGAANAVARKHLQKRKSRQRKT